MNPEQFTYVWQYTVEPARHEEFLAAYRPGGAWAALFARDPAYFDTILIQGVEDRNRFMTIDFWRSAKDRNAFKVRYQDEFDALDAACESLTTDERFLGDFNLIGASGA